MAPTTGVATRAPGTSAAAIGGVIYGVVLLILVLAVIEALETDDEPAAMEQPHVAT